MSGIFGGGAQNKKMAQPLAAPSSSFNLRGVRGLAGGSGVGDVVPWQCWDKPGFKDCHAANWTKANTYCKGLLADYPTMYGGDMTLCINESTDAADWSNCVPKYCPPVKTAAGITWRASAPSTAVKQLQASINVHLKALGWDLISTDGILGPGTCGAAKYMDDLRATTYFRDYALASVCQTSKVPTKGGKPVNTVAVAPQVTITGESATVAEASLPWDTVHADTAEVQRRLNVQLDSADMNQLNVNSRLDAPTCGAMKWMKDTQGYDMLTLIGKNCQGFVAPTKRVKTTTPVVVGPTTPTGPTGPVNPLPARTSQASMAATGLLMGAVGVGIWALGKKYNWF